MVARRRIFLVAVFTLSVAVPLVTTAAATAAPGDRIWVRSISSSALAEDFLDVAKGQQRTVYAVGFARATEESGRMLVARYAVDGKRLWARVYGAGGGGAYGRCLLVVPGGVIVAGTAGNLAAPNRQDILVVKYAGDGRRLWTLRYDGPGHRDDYPADLALGPGGTVYVGGTSAGKGTGPDYVVMQVAQSYGSVLWTRRYDGPASADRLEAIQPYGLTGDVYVTGTSADGGGSTAAATIKYSVSGRRIWVRRLHAGAGRASGAGISLDVDNGAVYVAGSALGDISPGWDWDVMSARLSMATGARQWVRLASVPNGDEWGAAFSFDVPFPGGYGIAAVGSTTDRATGVSRAFVTSWAMDGTPLWQDEFNVGLPTDDATFFTVTHDKDGNMYCGGITSGTGGVEDFTVVKYAPTGAFLWGNVYDSPAHGTDICRDVAAGYGGLYAVGFRSRTMLDTSALLIKYEP